MPIDPSNPLGLLFVVSFAVQQVLEALAWPVENRFGEAWKKTVLGIIGFLLGLFLASQLDLYILQYYIPGGVATSGLRGGILDTVLTALILSAGTEGTNSVLKYLKYLKEDKKAQAAETVNNIAPRTQPAGAAGQAQPANAAVAPAAPPAQALSYIGNK